MSTSFHYPVETMQRSTERILPPDWDDSNLSAINVANVTAAPQDTWEDFEEESPPPVRSVKHNLALSRVQRPLFESSLLKRDRDVDVTLLSSDLTATFGDTIYLAPTTIDVDALRRAKEKLLKKARKSVLSRQEQSLVGPETVRKPVPPLGPKELKLLQDYMRAPKTQVLGEVHKVQLSVEDLRRFMPRCWLNDSVIDAYLAHLTEGTKSFAFTTHFYTKLEEGGPKSVKRWSIKRKLKVLEKDHILIPVNRNNMHWCLGVIDNKRKSFSFYDSLNGSGEDVVKNLEEYMVFETDKLDPSKHDLNVNLFKSYQRFPQAECSQQHNGSDCGVFLCRNAHQIATGEPVLAFNQDDIPIVRETMAYTLLKLAKGF